MMPLPLQFLVLMLAGWMNRQQQEVITYLLAENHILREQLGGKTLRFTDFEDGFLRGSRFLIHDRDPLFTKEFRRALAESGVRPVKLATRSPNLNAFAECFVRSTKSECLAQIIPLGERHLRRAVRECAEHYHHERNHQGLGNRVIDPNLDLATRDGAAVCRKRLGGVLCYYERAA